VAWFGALLLIAYWPILGRISRQWRSNDDMGHAVFVPLVVAAILWERREYVLSLPVARSMWGAALIAYGAVQACLGALGAEILLQGTAFVISVAGLVLLLAGGRVFRAVWFPLALLLFMVPVPGVVYKQVTFPLQLLASRLAEWSVEVLGYTVLREGNILEVAGSQLSVAEACSGIRSLLSLTFFSLAYGYLATGRFWLRAVLAVSAAPVAVAANSLRITIATVLSERDPDLAEGFFHGFSGWLAFLVSVAAIIAIHLLLSRVRRRA
jgi:exosortase